MQPIEYANSSLMRTKMVLCICICIGILEQFLQSMYDKLDDHAYCLSTAVRNEVA